ncbi:helix-turn-helix domain-containing protein [Streptomyces sp. NPDC058368]|uniref:helix-turn-helix domain-containing protein n=1 Tax=Streptomyces sp. NPDC058368 TaxID=3346461 RepID=UPI003663C353
MTQQGWMERYTQTVAAELRRHRERRGMSAQELADECARLGSPIQRSVIANLENGRRASVGVAEVLIFAAALRVPPGLLISPVGQVPAVEYLPGQEGDPFAVLQWVAGATTMDGEASDVTGNPLPLYDELTELLSEVLDNREKIESLVEITGNLAERHEALLARRRALGDEFNSLRADSDRATEKLSSEGEVSQVALQEARQLLDRMKSVNAEMTATSAEIEKIGQPFSNLEFYKEMLEGAEAETRRQIDRIRAQGLLPPQLPEPLRYLLDAPAPRKTKRARRP